MTVLLPQAGIICPSVTSPGWGIPKSWPVPFWDWVPPIWDLGTPHAWVLGFSQKGHGASHWGTPWKRNGTSGSIMGWRWVPHCNVEQTVTCENITSHCTTLYYIVTPVSIEPETAAIQAQGMVLNDVMGLRTRYVGVR